jgi:hypothetical protein
MKACLAILLLSSPALADTIGAEPNDPGKVTHLSKGVKELDLGGIFILSYNKVGENEASTRLQTLGGVGFQYFLKDNVSAGASFLYNYDRIDPATYSQGFGGTVFGSLHLRLGLGAFLRPTLGAGVIVGDLNTEVTPGMVVKASQVAGLVRVAMPFAYFPSRRIVLQAGPELDIQIGTNTPDGGEGESFTTVSGGFGVSAGYAF